jgi:hypothetical protein
MKADTPIKLANIREMTDDEVDLLLNRIRERRLKPVKDYEDAQALKTMSRRENLDKQSIKHFEMFEKELAQVDTVLDKLDARARKLRGVRLELQLIEEQYESQRNTCTPERARRT